MGLLKSILGLVLGGGVGQLLGGGGGGGGGSSFPMSGNQPSDNSAQQTMAAVQSTNYPTTISTPVTFRGGTIQPGTNLGDNVRTAGTSDAQMQALVKSLSAQPGYGSALNIVNGQIASLLSAGQQQSQGAPDGLTPFLNDLKQRRAFQTAQQY